jgi:recombination protein RecR
MQYTSETMERLIRELTKLPGIGRKTAQRLVFYLLKQPKSSVEYLSGALLDLKEKIRSCSICFNITEMDPCVICTNSKRDHHVICVVEEANDVLAIEKTGQYRGLYHVLGGVLNPLEGIGPESLRIKELTGRINENITEIILAINPDVQGDTTVLYLAERLKTYTVKLTRIARGIPIGSDLEFADQITLTRAMEGRQIIHTTGQG